MDQALQRTCHLCGKPVATRVWYSTVTQEKTRIEGQRKRRGKAPTRVYACPACFFERLDEKARAAYRKEALTISG